MTLATRDYTAIVRPADCAGGPRSRSRRRPVTLRAMRHPPPVPARRRPQRAPGPIRLLAAGLLLATAADLAAQTASDPDRDCYLAARDRGAAYPCDLAIQVARDPLDPAALTRALVNRALILTREDRLEAALKDLDSALETAPDDPRVYGNRGNLLLRMGRPQDALAAHGRAIELAPDDPTGYYNRAFVWLALGEETRARADVAAATERIGAAAGDRAPVDPSALSPESSAAADGAPGR